MSRFVLAALLAGADPVSLHQAQQQAAIEMMKCYYAQASALDDHLSSAAVVAEGVVSACHPQIDDWKYASFEELLPPDARTFYRTLEEGAPRMATEVVLKVRAAAKH